MDHEKPFIASKEYQKTNNRCWDVRPEDKCLPSLVHDAPKSSLAPWVALLALQKGLVCIKLASHGARLLLVFFF